MSKSVNYGNNEQRSTTKQVLRDEIPGQLHHNNNMTITVTLHQQSLFKTSNTQ